MPVAFFSRHPFTPAQDATMRALQAQHMPLSDPAQRGLVHGGEILFPALPEGYTAVATDRPVTAEAVTLVREALARPELTGVSHAVIALVAPAWVAPMLLTAGFTVITFENAPSARQRGVFICTGGVAQTLYTSDGGTVELVTYRIACPVSEDEQIESALAPRG